MLSLWGLDHFGMDHGTAATMTRERKEIVKALGKQNLHARREARLAATTGTRPPQS